MLITKFFVLENVNTCAFRQCALCVLWYIDCNKYCMQLKIASFTSFPCGEKEAISAMMRQNNTAVIPIAQRALLMSRRLICLLYL